MGVRQYFEAMASQAVGKPDHGNATRWSYGVLVYEMLVGRSPFNDADVRGLQGFTGGFCLVMGVLSNFLFYCFLLDENHTV